MSSTPNAIELRQLEKSFGLARIIQGVDLAVEKHRDEAATFGVFFMCACDQERGICCHGRAVSLKSSTDSAPTSILRGCPASFTSVRSRRR